MAGFNTTTEELDTLAKRIIEADETAQAKIRQVRDAAETVASSWKGSAFTAFQNLISRFDADAAKVQEALRAIAEQISDTSKVYAQNEAAQEAEISNVTARLG
jgi:WXG100 family type VII secretion target